MRPPLFEVGSDPVLGRLGRLALPAVLGALLGLVAGLGVHQLTPPTYTAQVRVELAGLRDQMDLNPVGSRGQLVSVDTDAQLATSDAVVLAVAAQQQRPVRTVRASLVVTARPVSRILVLSYTARSAQAAQEGAALAADRFLEERERLYVTPHRVFLDEVSRTTEAIDPRFDLAAASGSVPGRESLRRRAFVRELDLVESGRVVGEQRLTAAGDRGDIEVPLTSGAATGALLAVLLVLLLDLRRGMRAPPADTVRRHTATRPPSRLTRRVVAGVAVTVVVCTGVSALAALLVVPQNFEGRARVYVPPEGGNAYASRQSRTVQAVDFGTEAELARSDEVLDGVARDPRVQLTSQQLRARTSTATPDRGQVVEITFRGATREQTETVTQLLAEQTVAVREVRAARWNAQQQDAFDVAIAAAESDLEAALGPSGSRDLVNALNRRVTLLREDARTLLSDRTEGGGVLSTRVERRQADTYTALSVAAAGPVVGLLAALVTRGWTRSPRMRFRRAHSPLAVPGPARHSGRPV